MPSVKDSMTRGVIRAGMDIGIKHDHFHLGEWPGDAQVQVVCSYEARAVDAKDIRLPVTCRLHRFLLVPIRGKDELGACDGRNPFEIIGNDASWRTRCGTRVIRFVMMSTTRIRK